MYRYILIYCDIHNSFLLNDSLTGSLEKLTANTSELFCKFNKRCLRNMDCMIADVSDEYLNDLKLI